MLNAIVHCGRLNESTEYFATVTGPELDRKFFFEQAEIGSGLSRVRYFGGGSAMSLDDRGVYFTGNGGIFSQYMFGGHFPVQDLLNEEVRNRLLLFGTFYDADARELRFTPQTSGYETYENLFLHGNAVSNYLFFIDDRGGTASVVERQEQTLRTVGKLLKRSARVGAGNFLDLAAEMRNVLGEPESTIFIIRLVHRENRIYYEACRDAYSISRSLDDLLAVAQPIPESAGMDTYQRERIQIDVIYQHPENYELIDEYKRVLAGCAEGQITPSERARLMRLRTLSLRNQVPLSIFNTLEEIVLKDGALSTSQEPDYIQSTREILQGFTLGRAIHKKISHTDMVQLLENKRKASANRDQRFEEILLETGRVIDEITREEENADRLESFSELITLFDRFDHTIMIIDRLAFMDDVELTQEQVRSVIGNMHIFEQLRRGLFQALLIDPVLSNQYALSYGRRKLFALILGLIAIDNNEASLADLTGEIRHINRQERAYFSLYRLARRRMSTFYLELNTPEGRETFRREITLELTREPELWELQEFIDDELVEDVITKIRLEAFYINQLLPRIIEHGDTALRADFLTNSGLDRFQVEELEREYLELRAYPPHLLEKLQGK